MAVRNCQEIGDNLILIISRLMANDNLVKLLYYTDKDPLNNDNLTEAQKKEEIFDRLIKITPRIGAKETAKSVMAVRVARGSKNSSNKEFRDVKISIEIVIPLTQWLIKGTNLRPFAILGEIQKSLEGKNINGLGRMEGGDFNLNFITDEVASYEQTFSLITYD